MSVDAVADIGNLVVFSKDKCFIIDQVDHSIIATGHRTPGNGFYCFGNNLEANSTELNNSAALWLCVMGI
jgi:hypothetical protein